MVTFKKIKQTVTGKLLVEGECTSTDSKPIDIIANGSKLFEIDTGSWYFFDEGAKGWVKSVRGGTGNITVDDLDITENGVYTPEDEQHAFGRITVDVPNSYIDEEEGMVVHNGGLIGYSFPVVETYTDYLNTVFNEVDLTSIEDSSYGHAEITLRLPLSMGGFMDTAPLYWTGAYWVSVAMHYNLDEDPPVVSKAAELIVTPVYDEDEGFNHLELSTLIMQKGTTIMDITSSADLITATLSIYHAGDPWPPVDEDEPEPEPEEP